MAGTIVGFDAANFRTQIRNTMIKGLPADQTQWPTFYAPATETWPTTYPDGSPINFDDDGKPYDPDVRPLPMDDSVGIQVPCAVEFKATTTDDTTLVGNFRDTAAVLTILDTDYALVADAEIVLLGGMRYYINYLAPPIGLAEVTVYQLYLSPQGESNVSTPTTPLLSLGQAEAGGHAAVGGSL
jgi:hypothetical protein